jgi:hypothetical protein
MACVVVWQLLADRSPQAREFKNVLVRLSGRQTKWGRPHTAPALLDHYSLHDLKRSAASCIPLLNSG